MIPPQINIIWLVRLPEYTLDYMYIIFRLLTSDSKVVRLGVCYIVYTAVAEIFSGVVLKFQEVYGKGKVCVHLVTVTVWMGRTYGKVRVVGAIENQTWVNVRIVD